jgi:acyl-coenzyme A synthetase/AMP-(fatty) acid ligase
VEIKKHIPFVPFRVVPVKQIPRNHMGKIERRALTEYAQGLVDRQAAEGNVADSE